MIPVRTSVILSILIVQTVLGAPHYRNKAILPLLPEDLNSGNKTVCQPKQPCGWYVYTRINNTYYGEYPVKFPCECGPGLKCFRSTDDISVSAYIYICKPIDEIGKVILNL